MIESESRGAETIERPIPFIGPMVRAILDGRKTETRRVIKLQPQEHHWRGMPGYELLPSELHQMACGRLGVRFKHTIPNNPNPEFEPWVMCPYGRPGDRLWVRETFALLGNEDGVCIDWTGKLIKGNEREAARIYRASCDIGEYGLWHIPDKADWKPDTEDHVYEGPWRASIHMPRWASRILLEVTDIRVERLHDITYESAVAEGVYRDCSRVWTANDEGGPCHKYPVPAFRDLWQMTGGDWDANPWLWVVEFKRV